MDTESLRALRPQSDRACLQVEVREAHCLSCWRRPDHQLHVFVLLARQPSNHPSSANCYFAAVELNDVGRFFLLWVFLLLLFFFTRGTQEIKRTRLSPMQKQRAECFTLIEQKAAETRSVWSRPFICYSPFVHALDYYYWSPRLLLSQWIFFIEVLSIFQL